MIEAKPGVAVNALIGLILLLSVGALGGGAVLMIAPDGSILGVPGALLADTPFPDYLIPGMLLFTFLGVYPLLASYALWRRPGWTWPDRLNPFARMHWAWTSGLAAGVILVVWIGYQMIALGWRGVLQYIYLGWGFVLLLLAALPAVRTYYLREPRSADKNRPVASVR